MKIDINKISSMSLPERFKYLRENERELIKTKCSTEITSDINTCSPYIQIKQLATKSIDNPEPDVIRVKVVANTSNWIDSQLDMILPDAVNKSLKERKDKIPHLHDHLRETTAKVGEVKDIYMQDFSFSELGIRGQGVAKALIFETDIRKDYNEKIFNQYKNGGINQHSIGLRYINMVLAMNDVNDPERLKLWNEFIGQAINREVADKNGYFWVVKEYKLIENSAVLFGANEITPTLEVSGGKNYIFEPDKTTQEMESRIKALEKAANEKLFNEMINKINNLKF